MVDLSKWTRPEVEHIGGLTPVIVIDQRRIGGNARSTVGTITDAWTYLRLLFSRLSEPYVGESNHFSFNDPVGMCPTCSGLGKVVVSAVEQFLDFDKSLAAGAITLPGFGNGGYWYSQYADIGTFDVDTPLREVVEALAARLDAMVTIGLGYLTLSRATTTLSGGESQRIKTVTHLGSSLTEMTYVVDEPTVGLHPTDVESMIELLERLRDSGNSVLVVEHDPAVMAHADQIIEVGPEAGNAGGRLVFQGTFAELGSAGTATGQALARQRSLKVAPRRDDGKLTVVDASRNNLRNVTVSFPTGVMSVLTGVAGSGKSSLAEELVEQHGAVVIDQKPVSANRRSTPITYTGIAPAIRKLFARHNDVPAALFSANSAGACPDCKGLGVIYTDLAFMEGREVVCETCHGRRFTPEVLAHEVNGLSIADVDELTIDEAIALLPEAAIARALGQLAAVGLGYLRLGQSLNTLSGGECQRVKIAKELRQAEQPTTYVLDEPTTGLHLSDIDMLLHVLESLVDHGHTVVVVEHNLDVIRQADWLIDLGPGPGRHGGTILFEGHPADYTHPETPTSAALAHPS